LVTGFNEVSNGSNANYQEFLQWLGGVTLNDDNLEELKKRIDLDNYTNYLQSEIYFLNKDWPANNLKRWRSSLTNSKWKWLLYDTDFGFGSTNPDPEVKMLDFITEPNGKDYPNPPHSTLIIRKLLQNQNYKNAFINRFSLLLATYYSPAKVEARINALMAAIESEIPQDQQRWNLSASTMTRGLTTIRDFGRNRAAQMQKEIEEFFKLGNPIDFTFSIEGNGKILVHNLPLNETTTFKAYPSVPITIKAVPNAGASFMGWSDGSTAAERTVYASQTTLGLEARFSLR
jgi:Trp operon repressor